MVSNCRQIYDLDSLPAYMVSVTQEIVTDQCNSQLHIPGLADEGWRKFKCTLATFYKNVMSDATNWCVTNDISGEV